MQVITQYGSFAKPVADLINANFAELQNGGAGGPTEVWVRPQYGNNSGNGSVRNPHGSYANAFATMSGLANVLEPGLIVRVEGVLTEEYEAPKGVNNVSVIGVSNIPRQATTSGAPNGGGATWLSPSGGTGALLTLQAQGWMIANLYFNNSATANPDILILTDGSGDPPVDADGSHTLIVNCILTGSDDGIVVSGGTNFVRVIGCTLFGFSGAGDVAMKAVAGAGIGTLLDWRIEGCKFFNNASNIVMGLSHATIKGCLFENGSEANINLTGGTAPNFVQQNAFNIAAADFDPAGGTTGVTGDVWSNYLTDAVETGLPAN